MSSKEAGSEESKVSCVVCFCYVHRVEVALVVCMYCPSCVARIIPCVFVLRAYGSPAIMAPYFCCARGRGGGGCFSVLCARGGG